MPVHWQLLFICCQRLKCQLDDNKKIIVIKSNNALFIISCVVKMSTAYDYEMQKRIVHTVVRSFSILLAEEFDKLHRKKKRQRIWVRNWMKNKTLGASETIIRDLYNNDPKEYKAVMRMMPEKFEELLCLIEPVIKRSDTLMRQALPSRMKLELTLAFLASGTNFRILSIFFRVSKSSISHMIPAVCDAIYNALKNFIEVPSLQQWEEIQEGFGKAWNFPGCCGTIDGRHISIKAPPSAGSQYYNEL